MITPTEEQRYKARATSVIGQLGNVAANVKRLIEEGVIATPDGQLQDSGMKGWDGFEEDQKTATQSFIHDFAGSIIQHK